MARKKKTLDPKPCGDCGQPVERRLRVRNGDGPWTLVCEACWTPRAGRSDYVYGGEWRARKRR